MFQPTRLKKEIVCSDLLFEGCFEGAIFSSPALKATQRLGAWARGIVGETFGEQPESLDGESFRTALSQARSKVATAEGRRLVWHCLADLGFSLSGLLLDELRLRAVAPGLESVPEAAPVFYAHRDTWYGNPRCQLNGWIPLYRVDGENSFRFYLDAFRESVANDSQDFQLTEFETRGGFGRTQGDPVSSYPRALNLGSYQGRSWDVQAEQDSFLLFSASHLHQTLPNRTPQVRFSLDFRFLREADLELGFGAPDLDNRSHGSTASSYYPCPTLWSEF